MQFFPHDPAKITLCTAIFRAIIICQVKLCDSMVKCRKTHRLHVLIIIIGSKIMPETKGQYWKQQSALSYSSVFHGFISLF